MLKRLSRLFSAANTYGVSLLATVCLYSFISSGQVSAQDVTYPVNVKVSPTGVVFVADRGLPGIWKVEGGTATVFHAASKKIRSPLNAIRCLAFDADGKLLAGDRAGRDVYRFGDDGKPVGLTGGKISTPMGIAVDKNGDILVSDLTLQCIFKIPKAGGKPIKVADVPAPTALAQSDDGSLYVLSRNKQAQLFRLNAEYKLETLVAKQTFGFPLGLTLAADKTIYVSDGYGKTVWRIATGKAAEKFASGAPLVHPSGLAWQGTQLLVLDARARAVLQVDPQGKVTELVKFPKPKKKAVVKPAAKKAGETKKDATKKDAVTKDAAKKADVKDKKK